MTTLATDDQVLKHITTTIVSQFHPRRIILFGSRGRGDAQPDSDYDVLVEMETDLPFHQRMSRIYEAFGFHQVPMDVLVFTPEEMEQERSKVFSVAKIAEREGTVLYDAA